MMKTIVVLTVVLLGCLVKGQMDIVPDYGFGYYLTNQHSFFPEKNVPCVIGAQTPNIEGICTHSFDCTLSGGRSPARGNCSILHTCCIHQKTCSQTSKARVTYFRQPSTPRLETPQTCSLTIQKANNNVCQMRVDIINMNIQPPDPTEVAPFTNKCSLDSFQVKEMYKTDMLPICGTDSNNHFYIHLNQGQNEIHLDMHLAAISAVPAGSTPATWNIKITQLECPTRENNHNWNKKENRNQLADDFQQLAPPGCLQYHTDYMGTIKSFGYNGGNDVMTTGNDYAVCFKRYGECNIEFTAIDVQFGNEEGKCDVGFIFIPESENPHTICQSDPAQIKIEKHPGPMYIHVHNEDEVQNQAQGFSLTYTQSC